MLKHDVKKGREIIRNLNEIAITMHYFPLLATEKVASHYYLTNTKCF